MSGVPFRCSGICLALVIAAIVGVLAGTRGEARALQPATAPATAPAGVPTTAPASGPIVPATTAASIDLGPDVVILKELSSLYEPVPFDHRSHAMMAEMWDGCVTCHHYEPLHGNGTTQPATQDATHSAAEPTTASRPTTAGHAATSATTVATTRHGTTRPRARTTRPTKVTSASVPACKSCHVIAATETDIHMPSLKGAYHRQCLNCHKEWMHANACVACHKPLHGQTEVTAAPTRDDILGRMHPPIPEPEAKLYEMRYTPVDGGNVLFRHKQHTVAYGLRCTNCHYRDNCINCHDPQNAEHRARPVKPGMTWAESHGPCVSCHQNDRCSHCHYKDEQDPPPTFQHAVTGQTMDSDHADLACGQCHLNPKLKLTPTCGDSSCHTNRAVSFPADRPGPTIPVAPTTLPAMRGIGKVRPG